MTEKENTNIPASEATAKFHRSAKEKCSLVAELEEEAEKTQLTRLGCHPTPTPACSSSTSQQVSLQAKKLQPIDRQLPCRAAQSIYLLQPRAGANCI